jgi:hypothetical protein
MLNRIKKFESNCGNGSRLSNESVEITHQNPAAGFNSSGSLAMLTTTRRASSSVSTLACIASASVAGSRENLHLVERWTRTAPSTLEYEFTIEDPTVWTRPWTVKQEFTRQSDQENRIYYEPRCIEGNYALPGLLRGARMEELAFAEGRGPDPATKDNSMAITGDEDDPLQ